MLAKPDAKVVFDESGKAIGVSSEGETAKCKKVVGDPSYFPGKVRTLQSSTLFFFNQRGFFCESIYQNIGRIRLCLLRSVAVALVQKSSVFGDRSRVLSEPRA